MKSTVLLLSLAALPVSAAPRPNIVFILADDLGYGDLSCYNSQSKIPTPRLDRLAQEGVRFTDAHAPDSVCTPSRYAILTGQYCFRIGFKKGVLHPWARPIIAPGMVTVPSFLRQAGYATACIGKWHLGFTWPTKDGRPPSSKDGIGNIDFSLPIADGPTARGFDTFFGVDAMGFPPYGYIRDNRVVGIPSVPVLGPLQKGGNRNPGPKVPGWKIENVMPDLTRDAVAYIAAAAAKSPRRPFFLYFALTAPHYPVVPTAEFKGRSRAGAYGDFVTELDATVGEVQDELDRTGLARDTLILVGSDNGPETIEIVPGAYERIQIYGHSSMGDLRGAKRDTWEGGHRIPFIACWPGHVPAGVVSAEPVCEVDLMATCAALVGVPLPAGAGPDSCNILPALLGQRLNPARRPIVLHSGDGKFGIRDGDWVFIDAPSGSGNKIRFGVGVEPLWYKRMRGYVDDGFPGELYNLRQDLPERHNLYGEHPEIVRRLKALLESFKASGGSIPVLAMESIPDE